MTHVCEGCGLDAATQEMGPTTAAAVVTRTFLNAPPSPGSEGDWACPTPAGPTLPLRLKKPPWPIPVHPHHPSTIHNVEKNSGRQAGRSETPRQERRTGPALGLETASPP